MTDFTKIQKSMFDQGQLFLDIANAFSAISSDCRLEILYLLSKIESLPSGEIWALTNCTPSQVSQYLAKMYDAQLVLKKRTWRAVEYSLNRDHPVAIAVVHIFDKKFR